MMGKTITLTHDSIDYTWHDVPEKKYQNWKRMSGSSRDLAGFAAPGYPYMLQIEPTSLCNLGCPLCPAGRKELNRELRHMTLAEFQVIIDDMADYLLFLVMWDWGEPLLNPDLPAMIRYASDRGIRTVTSTNAHFLTDEKYLTDLLNSGLTTIIVAIDSLEPEKYEVYRQKGNLNRALRGLRTLIGLKKRCGSPTTINLRMVVMKQNEGEVERMRREAKNLGADLFTVKTLNPSCGVTGLDGDMIPDNPAYRRYEYLPGTYQRIRSPGRCDRIWQMSNIFSNGDVAPCCYDYNAELKTGNIHAQKFSEIWNGPRYRELRKRLETDKDSVEKCRVCGINYVLSPSGWFVEATDFRDPRLVRSRISRTVRTVRSNMLRRGQRVVDILRKVPARIGKRGQQP